MPIPKNWHFFGLYVFQQLMFSIVNHGLSCRQVGHKFKIEHNANQSAFTQIPTCMLLLIVCAVHPGKSINTARLSAKETGERLQR